MLKLVLEEVTIFGLLGLEQGALLEFHMFSAYAVDGIGWSGRVDSNHRPQRPERCALNQTALRPASGIL